MSQLRLDLSTKWQQKPAVTAVNRKVQTYPKLKQQVPVNSAPVKKEISPGATWKFLLTILAQGGYWVPLRRNKSGR